MVGEEREREKERDMGEKGKERKEERGCERVERGREREIDLEGEREGCKKKYIER